MTKHDHRHSDHPIMYAILKEMSELNEMLKKGIRPALPARHHAHFAYAFDPTSKTDSDAYRKYIMLNTSIHDVLCESWINIRSRGHTYTRDAICIIIDHNSYDVCLSKEIYPHIAEKHRIKWQRVEHSIRNCIDSAYRRYLRSGRPSRSLMRCFDGRPSNKEFLIFATQEVNRRLWNEIYV